MKLWIGSRPISRPTSISIAFSAYRDDSGAERGNNSDQDCVGTTVKPQRSPNIGRLCRTAAISHDGALDMNPAIRAGAPQREAERTRHGRFRIAGVGRKVMGRVTPQRAPR